MIAKKLLLTGLSVISMSLMCMIHCGCSNRSTASLKLLSRDYTFSNSSLPFELSEGQNIISIRDEAAESFTLRFSIQPDYFEDKELIRTTDIVKVEIGIPEGSDKQSLITTLYLTDSITSNLPRKRETPESFLCDFTIIPDITGKGKATIDFGNGNMGGINLDNDRAWFTSSTEESPRTLAEGGDVSTAHNYAITACIDNKEKSLLELSSKFDGSVIDIEIDSRRTMLSYRPGLTVTETIFNGDKISLKK